MVLRLSLSEQMDVPLASKQPRSLLTSNKNAERKSGISLILWILTPPVFLPLPLACVPRLSRLDLLNPRRPPPPSLPATLRSGSCPRTYEGYRFLFPTFFFHSPSPISL
ncbi:hypothetical protein NPIL_272761 [Nephila pilipes]|uniref:Uncharacterized protein n=1 Tax=Nephila pilipes TaxID=299642 RepID=A0A8X6QZ55_NEPPI|nr:hypothetical protein NPIL_272761 [Nephila pilipes]